MKRKVVVITSLAAVAVVAIGLSLTREKGKQALSLEVSAVSSGTMISTVTATGTVQPIDQVDVGTQVSGVINNVYVDFNSQVKRGELLAEIDKSTLSAKLLQTKASLASAQNEFTYQEQNYNRTKRLFETGMVSDVDYESAVYKYNNAKLTVERLRSEVEQAEVNLSYASITSPIDGVVLARNIEAGQTVAASFNTPTLFSLARDLTRMQVEANIDEADIGQVLQGQRVTFTVDAYPNDEFTGVVTQIRLEPTVVSNVVTYTVIIEAENPELKLMPGLTASITVITKELNNIALIPAKAVRYTPSAQLAAQYTVVPFQMPENARPNAVEGERPAQASKPSFVWVKNGNQVLARMVKTGMDDGARVQVLKGLEVGDSIVVAEVKPSVKVEAQAKSPFMPQPPRPSNTKK
ncbi:MAG: efflux RND transporter periplasmic adaptor subunit [Bacteroidales bacterium]|nr:efflux RND transporter periplasmic adaptor subunit [Bacteroidales bacterium]MBN2751035.1 efflux RND transporter periplasmic adaptor subunit [Bacteroidales bacterium]